MAKGEGRNVMFLSDVSAEVIFRTRTNQVKQTEKINISHKNLNPHRDHLGGETQRASPFHITLLIKY